MSNWKKEKQYKKGYFFASILPKEVTILGLKEKQIWIRLRRKNFFYVKKGFFYRKHQHCWFKIFSFSSLLQLTRKSMHLSIILREEEEKKEQKIESIIWAPGLVCNFIGWIHYQKKKRIQLWNLFIAHDFSIKKEPFREFSSPFLFYQLVERFEILKGKVVKRSRENITDFLFHWEKKASLKVCLGG